jgi:hypothetical protein
MCETLLNSGSDRHMPTSADGRISGFSRSIDWYAEGESRIVDVDGVRIEVRFTGRKGRRSRIAIIAPPGAMFRSMTGG